MSLASLQAELRRRLKSKKTVLLLLDFDGTLAKIVRRPGDATLDRDAERVLRRLRKLPRVRIFVLSGRSRRDLSRRMRVPGIHRIGDHGFDAGAFSPRVPASWLVRKARLRQDLQRLIRAFPGGEMEEKPLSLSVHFRRVAPSLRRRFQRRLRLSLRKGSARGLWRLRDARMAIEILPPVDWGKGEAARAIAKQFPQNSLIVVAGDDRTDEEMFRALPKAVSVRIGSGPSAARHRLRGPKAMARLLSWLASEIHPYSQR